MDESSDNPNSSPKQERSPPSDCSLDSTPTIVASPKSPAQRRPGYQRISSLADEITAYRGAGGEPLSPIGQERGLPSDHGLAIENAPTHLGIQLQRIGLSSKSGLGTSDSMDPLLSASTAGFGGDFRSLKSHTEDDEDNLCDPDQADQSRTSFFEPFIAESEQEGLRQKTTARSTGTSVFNRNTTSCLVHGRWSGAYISIFILALYSTTLSSVWLVVALYKPRFGRYITTNGIIRPATARILCTIVAKSIELSFVAVFVALIGQVLSRRAFNAESKSKGFTIAEMSMRTWVSEPSKMITNWNTVKNGAVSFLGGISVAAALMAMFYTPASEALVSPKLMFGPMENRLMYGKVTTSWANPTYVSRKCRSPITIDIDPEARGPTCMAIEHSGQAYHNYAQYLSKWADLIDQGSGSAPTSLRERPAPIGTLYDNTTVQGSWVNVENMTKESDHSDRIINNVSMAMPHPGVFAAARDSSNNILQPEDLGGLGEYRILASVPSPFINVLCAEMTKEELKPMVYTEWPLGKSVNMTFGPDWYDKIPRVPSWLNSTRVDEVFGFGEKYGRRHPVFPKYPSPQNTILNLSSVYVDSMYLLATSASSKYMLCSLRATQSFNCSTEYHATMIGGSLISHCDESENDHSYRKSLADSKPPIPVPELDWSKEWVHVAGEWAKSMALNGGILDANASNARVLTQLFPIGRELNPALPSIAEALGVLAGCTLLISSLDSSYTHYWNYSQTILETPGHQSFQASISSQAYASGGTQQWQGVFVVVLVFIAVMNFLCLVCLLVFDGLVTDFVEPQNLFCLSMNSPQSESLGGNSWASPRSDQLQTPWFIRLEKEGQSLYIEEGPQKKPRRKRSKSGGYNVENSPMVNMYTKLSTKRTSIL